MAVRIVYKKVTPIFDTYNLGVRILHFNNSKMAEYYSIFSPDAIQYLLRYSLRGWILQPRTITYSLCLQFDLDTRASVFASTMNTEAGPRFAEIRHYVIILLQPKNIPGIWYLVLSIIQMSVIQIPPVFVQLCSSEVETCSRRRRIQLDCFRGWQKLKSFLPTMESGRWKNFGAKNGSISPTLCPYWRQRWFRNFLKIKFLF